MYGADSGVLNSVAVGKTHPAVGLMSFPFIAVMVLALPLPATDVHCIASRRNRSTHIRAIELATSVLRASRFAWIAVFCMVMTAAAPIIMSVIAMRISITVNPRAS